MGWDVSVIYFQCVYNTDSCVDVNSVNFNSKKGNKLFGRQDILQFWSGVFKYYKYVKYPYTG